MRYLKVLGLAALAAMAVMAFAGAGSASATVLCATTPVNNDCPIGWDYPAETPFDWSIVGSAVFEDTSGSTTIHTCTGGTLKGTTVNTGSGTETVSVKLTEWTWSGCTAAVTTVRTGTLELHALDTHNAIVTSLGGQWTTNTSMFGSCIYGTAETGTSLGTISAGESGTVSINAVLNKVSGSFACPSSMRWTASGHITTPNPAYYATTMG